MDHVLARADEDDDVKALVVRASGEGFCAGRAIVGLEEMGEVYPIAGPTPERTGKHPPLRLWEFPKATIAQVHGYCVGGGIV